MKKCVPCGKAAEPSDPYCTDCGEASWTGDEIDLTASMPPSESESSDAVDGDASEGDTDNAPKKGRNKRK